MTKYLHIFNKYCDLLDEEFDDSLIVEYKNVDKPNFIIIYDPTVDRKLLDKSIPKEWRDLEKNKEIILDIHMYEKDTSILENHYLKELQNGMEELCNNL
jgi:hypothetical protein